MSRRIAAPTISDDVETYLVSWDCMKNSLYHASGSTEPDAAGIIQVKKMQAAFGKLVWELNSWNTPMGTVQTVLFPSPRHNDDRLKAAVKMLSKLLFEVLGLDLWSVNRKNIGAITKGLIAITDAMKAMRPVKAD